jgi:hypothetical protein
MKGKSLMMLVFLVLASFGTFGQELINEAKIVEVYGQDFVDSRRLVQPDMLVLMDKYISHGFLIQEDADGKFQSLEPLEMIPLRTEQMDSITIEQFLQEYNNAGFNPLRYLFFTKVEGQVYRLKGTNKMICILPQETIQSK